MNQPIARRTLLRSGLAAAAMGTLPFGARGDSKALIGLAMPTMSALRWINEGLGLVRELDHLDYPSELQYGNDDVTAQITQIRAMAAHGAKILVIGAIDGGALAPVLEEVSKKGVKVIAYDRLIRNTPHLDYYVTFDNFLVGVMQARDIETRLKLKQGGRGTIELFAGAADDNNTHWFYDGAMSVLKPYIESGTLVVGSGKWALADVTTPHWNGNLAKARLQGILASAYAKRRLDAVLSPYDGMSVELINGLKFGGYGQPGQPWPVMTGQDAELPSIRAIQRGEQTSTIFKDTRELVKVCTVMADAIAQGKPPQINDTKSYNNGVKTVQSFLLPPQVVTKENWHKVLFDSGYYKEDQL